MGMEENGGIELREEQENGGVELCEQENGILKKTVLRPCEERLATMLI